MFRHLTNTDHLIQEDLRVLICAILKKQETRENKESKVNTPYNFKEVSYC